MHVGEFTFKSAICIAVLLRSISGQDLVGDNSCGFEGHVGPPQVWYSQCSLAEYIDYCPSLCMETEGCVYFAQVRIPSISSDKLL